MGTYLNPGNGGFTEIRNSLYVDKSGMIDDINQTINTRQKLTCISRPRRFGKSFAAKMLCAYYDCSCDSHALFDDLNISKKESYSAHINQYNVIYLDITGFLSRSMRSSGNLKEVPNQIVAEIKQEIQSQFPPPHKQEHLSDCLLRYVESTGKKFVFIIDEWDALIREARFDHAAQDRYLNLLREWFKNNNFTPKVIAAAYMTGILPIKKDGSQSAISDFIEYSVLKPRKFAPYVGFTETEVQKLCEDHGRDFSRMKQWYNGYTFKNTEAIYNPHSVISAIENNEFESYWKQSSAAEALLTYINMDEEGLQQDIIRLTSGSEIEVDTSGFENDFSTFKSKDDILTLLIHLGYLSYHEDEDGTGLARIPNEEIRIEFNKILRKGTHKKLMQFIHNSDLLLKRTLEMDASAVAEALEKIHDSITAPRFYNDEQALRSTIRMAYLSCVDQYIRIEELPSGHGYADVAFLPGRRSPLPAMIIELKWNQSAESALAQITDRNYPAVFREYDGDVLLVGVNYDAKSKVHTCMIKKL